MYDPTIGRWISEDPLGFEAADPNLYRYVHNSPTSHTDASGLVDQPLPLPRDDPSARARELQGLPISDHFRLNVVFGHNAFSVNERRGIRSIMLQAAQRIQDAFTALNTEWDRITQRFRFAVLDDGNRIESPIWRLINGNRQNFLNKLRTAVTTLTRSDNRNHQIYVRDYRTETHPDTNPMYTYYLFGSAQSLRLRRHYWEIADNQRVFWMAHEFARYFLNLDDQERVGGYRAPEAVQTWDEYVGWLAERHAELNRVPVP